MKRVKRERIPRKRHAWFETNPLYLKGLERESIHLLNELERDIYIDTRNLTLLPWLLPLLRPFIRLSLIGLVGFHEILTHSHRCPLPFVDEYTAAARVSMTSLVSKIRGLTGQGSR